MYNEARYIGECIESILSQTYQNWDYSIIDNCSTDGCADIAREYAAKDSRLQVYKNEQHVRAVPNQNIALRRISPHSKYCKMVFADDWIFPECLQRMVAIAEEHPTVGIVGAYGLQGRELMWTGLTYPSHMMSGREICRRLFLEDLYVFGTGTSVMFRADLVRSHDPFYNERNLHADSETCCALLKMCDFGFVHQVLTFTRVRPATLTAFARDLNTLLTGRLNDLVMYGPDYLSPEEFELCLQRKVREYYKFLAHNAVRRRDHRFWEYHKNKLTELGIGFDRVRVAKAVVAKVTGAVLNPKLTVERFVARMRDVKVTTPSHVDPASVRQHASCLPEL